VNFLNALDISSSGLASQRVRMNLIAMNLSHMQTTRTPEGGPYRRKMPIFDTQPLFQGFRGRMKDSLDRELEDVQVNEVVQDRRDFKMVFDPSHPTPMNSDTC
jgi:flagellar basal-body rod protein FlgC